MNRGLLFLFILSGVMLLALSARAAEVTADRISDADARRELARTLSWQKGKEAEALVQYRSLLESNPDDPVLLRETALLLLRVNEINEAETLLQRAQKIKPELPGLAMDLAMLAVRRGHATEALSLFQQLGIDAEHGENEDRLRYADGMQLWGDFYRAETIYRHLLSLNENDTEMRLRLAKVFEAMQRYEEAEGIYQVFARQEATKTDALKGLVRIKRKEKNEQEAARYEAQLPESEREPAEAQLPAKKDSTESMHNQLQSLTEDGMYHDALTLCQTILQKDSEYFPARLDLALLLAEQQKYADSLQRLDALAASFDNPSLILLERARVLSWSRKYRESMAQYDVLHKLNPADPVPVREKARVAAWAKQMKLAQATYRKLLSPSVDQLLLNRLQKIHAEQTEDEAQNKPAVVTKMIALLQETPRNSSSWQGYRKLERQWESLASGLSKDEQDQIRQVLDEFYGQYLLQRNIETEANAKLLLWNKQYTKALDAYEQTSKVSPGNQEALFDMGQTAHALRMNDIAQNAYQRLLRVSPRNTEAREALEAQQRLTHAKATADVSFWEEEGRGELASMRRWKESTRVESPLFGRNRFNLSLHHWSEDPSGYGDTVNANGFSTGWESVLSPWISLYAGWTHKDYTGGSLDDQDFGYAGTTINLRDRLKIGLACDRREEITNAFSLQDGTTSDNLVLSLDAPLTRRWDISAKATAGEYSDHNNRTHLFAETSYILIEHPYELKLSGFGEYRDTEHVSEYRYLADALYDIEHPYWTPQNYRMAGGALEWRHDLSRLQFREAEQHYYGLRIASGNDSDNNSFIQLNAVWHIEFKKRWTVELSGFLHRSREWDAAGTNASVGFRF